ncbi:MAG: tetratricopeptide repeat protein [Spirochaetales bacterium]|nr:tetratricopeptide repeat protein [Spirochaetales bacterium]
MKRIIYLLLPLLLFANCAGFKTNPNTPETIIHNKFSQAHNYLHAGKLEKALTLYNQIIKIDPDHSDSYINRAFVWEIYKKYDKAREDLQKALEIDPGNYIAHFNLGNIYYVSTEYALAIEEYSSAIHINTSTAAPYLNRGNTYLKLREYDKALSDYEIYITLSDNQKEKITELIGKLKKRRNVL